MEGECNEAKKVDGSMLEGGGQLFRVAVALSYLLHQSLSLTNIRANRGKGGGLGNQHLTCISTLKDLAMKDESVYHVIGDKKGSKLLHLMTVAGTNRLEIERTEIAVNQQTPGSINLIIQCLLPCLVFQSGR